jgi:hypothetical protein
MNCLECREAVQRSLDGELPDDLGYDFERHLLTCADCRDLYGAAEDMLEVLGRLAHPSPPAGLSDRICACVIAESSRRRRSRRLLAATALAASVLGALFAGNAGFRLPFLPAATPVGQEKNSPPPTVALGPRMEEARTAVLALTRRTADETVGPTRFLFPAGGFLQPASESEVVREVLEPPARSLREAGEGMLAGLEPVTLSARRAVDLFLREVPPVGAAPTRQ